MPATKPFVVKFPLQIDNSGGLAVDETIQSELFFLSTVVPNQRPDDLEFGLQAVLYEQDHMHMDNLRMLTLLTIQIAIHQFVPECLVVAMNLLKNAIQRQLVLDIAYKDLNTADPVIQRSLIGLDVPTVQSAA